MPISKLSISFFIIAGAFITQSSVGNAAIVTKNIEYGTTKKFEGYMAMPKDLKASTPAILLIHNWLGISEETKYQAQRYAGLGYIVFAADVYGKGIRPTDPKEAGSLATKYKTDRKLLRERLTLAYNKLLEEKNVNKAKTVVMGYCFGGTAAIEFARSGAPIVGTMSFHGGLDSPTPADGKNIKGKVIAFHGAMDPFVPAKDVEAFENEMKTNKVSYQLIKYEGAVHSFTDKTSGDDIKKGAAYNKAADKKSFEAAKHFLKEVF